MIISGSPQSKVFFLGKVDFEPNITVKHDIKTVIYKVNQKFDHHTQPTNLLGLFFPNKAVFFYYWGSLIRSPDGMMVAVQGSFWWPTLLLAKHWSIP